MEVHFIQGGQVTRLQAPGVESGVQARWMLTVDISGMACLHKDGERVAGNMVGLPGKMARRVFLATHAKVSFKGVLKDITAWDSVIPFEDAIALSITLQVVKFEDQLSIT